MVISAWADASPEGIWTTTRNGSVDPAPKASVSRSHARYWVESVGNSELSSGPSRRSPLSTGSASTTSTARESARASPAWRVTTSAHRRTSPGRSPARAGSRTHGTRGVAMRWPAAPTIAGWRVNAESTTPATTSTTAYAMEVTAGTSNTSSATSATTTVALAVSTARPIDPTARAAASVGDSPSTMWSFVRPMTNSP